MKYCTLCLQPDTRPNTYFTSSGICPACSYFEHLHSVDWLERYEILKDLIDSFPKNKKQHFDCIIGVSGGKDSTRQALWVRDKLGLKPLLVSLSYPPEQLTERGVDNVSNLINLGFDVVISAPAPGTWKLLMRESFLKFTNWAKSTELALFTSVPQIAIHYGIYAGYPAKLVRYRFSEDHIKQLLDIQWWNWSMDLIKKNSVFFNTNLKTYKGDIKNILLK